MNGLIHDLTTELKTNPDLKDSAVVRVVLESINNSNLLGVPSDQILETALTNLDELATATVNENLKEVVSKFRKMAQKPTQRLQNMAKEAGMEMKLKMLKESNVGNDPTFAQTISHIEKVLRAVPEFRAFGLIFESLNKFNYDPKVATVLNDLNAYVNENRAKLEVMNAIFEMRQSSAVIYRDAITILEEALLEDKISADTIKMQMKGKVDMPIVNRLVNTLSMVEGKKEGKFNIGLGNGDAKVQSVIAPFFKLNEQEAIVFLDNLFIKLSESSDPVALTQEQALEHKEFYELCEAFSLLRFSERSNEIYTKGRNLEVSFAVNESGNLHLKLNGHKIEDLTKIDMSEIFTMEQMDVRSKLVKVFDNLDMIVNVEFAKKLINERLQADSIVVTIGETQYVFEKLGESRIVKKLEGLDFHNYVMEKFNYDVSELYSIQLSEREEDLKRIDREKTSINTDLEKLEESVKKLELALEDKSLSVEYQTQLTDLKESIQQNIVSLKNHYVELDQNKKKG